MVLRWNIDNERRVCEAIMLRNGTLEENKRIITNHIYIHPDDMEVLNNSIIELIEAGVGIVKAVKVKETSTSVWELLLTDDNECEYYLELGEHGSIMQLVKGGPCGDVLLDALCDDVGIL